MGLYNDINPHVHLIAVCLLLTAGIILTVVLLYILEQIH